MSDDNFAVDPSLTPPPPPWRRKEAVYLAAFLGFFLGLAYFIWIWWFANSLVGETEIPHEPSPDVEESRLEFIN